VTEPTKIRIRRICILYIKSIRFRFVTQSQPVQFRRVKTAEFCSKFRCVL